MQSDSIFCGRFGNFLRNPFSLLPENNRGAIINRTKDEHSHECPKYLVLWRSGWSLERRGFQRIIILLSFTSNFYKLVFLIHKS